MLINRNGPRKARSYCNKRFALRPGLGLLLFALAYLLVPASVSAQSPASTYWQYPASGRLAHTATTDLNQDGIDELVVVDENGKVDLLGADGSLINSYNADEPILSIHANILDESQPKRKNIILGARNRLTLLTAAGEEMRQKQISDVPTPIDILASGSAEAAEAWQERYEAVPVALDTIDQDGDGHREILVLLNTGQLQLYDADSNLLWRYTRNTNPSLPTEPQMAVGDLNGDGQAEIALGFFNVQRRFSQLAIVDRNGRLRWNQEQPISGRITALSLATFAGLPQQYIAIGTNLGQVSLYDYTRQRLWFRTLNKEVTTLAPVSMENGPGLAAGTAVGSVVAFDGQGQRVWSRFLVSNADRPIAGLSPAPNVPDESHPALSVVVGASGNNADAADIFLLAGNGRTAASFEAVDATGATRLIDVNGDMRSELLLARFAMVELLGIGVGANEIARDWEYNLFFAPRSNLILDSEMDEMDELLIGTEDGRLHRVGNNGNHRWLVVPGNTITHLAPLPDQPQIIVVRNAADPQPDGGNNPQSWIEVRQTSDGEQVWEQPVSADIADMVVGDFDQQGRPEIIVGTIDGTIIAFNAGGVWLWETQLAAPITQLLLIEGNGLREPELVIATERQLYRFREQTTPQRIAVFNAAIRDVHLLNQPGNPLSNQILVFADDGRAYALTTHGYRLPQWPVTLDGPPSRTLRALDARAEVISTSNTDSFLVATAAGQLRRLVIEDGQPRLSWLLTDLGTITSLFWGDLDSDGLPDLAVGTRSGSIHLYRVGLVNRRPEIVRRLELSSSVFGLSVLSRPDTQRADLLAVTQNGLIQLFRAQENRPPLLTNPNTDVAQGRYNIFVSVQDVENDPVTVRLDIQNPDTGDWLPQEQQRLTNSSDKLFWLVDIPPSDDRGVRYRFYYDDGFHQGFVTPPPGPSPLPATILTNEPFLGLLFLGAAGLIITVLFLRQTQSPASAAGRFYRHLQQQPLATLTLLEQKYTHTDGSPDFLLALANHARQRGDSLIAGLADGLFLLASRPHASLPIIQGALGEVKRQDQTWECLERWEKTHQLAHLLLEAPSVTELSLLRPQLVQLLNLLEETDQWSPAFEALLPILTNLRDSKRVDLAEDSLVYLNETAVLLREYREQAVDYTTSIDRALVWAIVERWSGLVGAEIEELRGRAELAITLTTKRLVSAEQTEVVLEIQNTGRAPAENLMATLEEDPAYLANGRPQIIPFLPPGRARAITFAITPRVNDSFRLGLNVTYDDRNRQDKTVAFGDMVHLLPPEREFKPFRNPYLPGTPLRRDSNVFFGRNELFNFISENVSHISQKNVLILVGQRRTGKTSMLLRLEQHLPDRIVPVYIDCQSLGVLPGMPALLHDLAWYIADALALRGLELEVPEPHVWQEDPTRHFQRRFLPQAQALLPEGTTLLLVFDEFEAFQNLVNDDILPPTLFPYMRHLIQHSEGLSFVFVGTRRLEEMSADYWSVLFNIALYQKIGYLQDEVAQRLITEPVAPNLIYDDLALSKILRVTAGHPYFLQLVCYTLVKRANNLRHSYVTISDVNAALDEMLSLGEVHFAYLWQRSSYAERVILTAMAHLMDHDVSFHPADMVQYLEPYGIQLTPGEVTAALHSLVEREILSAITDGATVHYELRIGLVGLWIAKQKSLIQLYASDGNLVQV